ncbi:MAG: nuclear transport factor 2 family protein [Myxococcota bacterium]
MIQHPNALLIQQILHAVSVGDRQTLRALWADDITWTVKGESPWAGEIKGLDEICEYLAALGEVGRVGFNVDVEEVMVSNTSAAVVLQGHAEVGEDVLNASYLLMAQIVSRKVQAVVTVPVDADIVARFWKHAAS